MYFKGKSTHKYQSVISLQKIHIRPLFKHAAWQERGQGVSMWHPVINQTSPHALSMGGYLAGGLCWWIQGPSPQSPDPVVVGICGGELVRNWKLPLSMSGAQILVPTCERISSTLYPYTFTEKKGNYKQRQTQFLTSPWCKSTVNNFTCWCKSTRLMIPNACWQPEGQNPTILHTCLFSLLYSYQMKGQFFFIKSWYLSSDVIIWARGLS